MNQYELDTIQHIENLPLQSFHNLTNHKSIEEILLWMLPTAVAFENFSDFIRSEAIQDFEDDYGTYALGFDEYRYDDAITDLELYQLDRYEAAQLDIRGCDLIFKVN